MARVRDDRRRSKAFLAACVAVACLSVVWSAARAVPTSELAMPALVSSSAAAAMAGPR